MSLNFNMLARFVRRRKGQQRIGWHYWLNGHEFEQTLGDNKGQGAWCAAIYGVAQDQTKLSDWTTRFVIAFLQRSKHVLISWLQLPPTVILEPKRIKSLTVSIISPSICHEVMGPDAIIFVSSMLCYKPAFHSSLSPSSRGTLVPFSFLPLEWCHLHVWGCWYFSWQFGFQLELHPVWQFTCYTLHIS